MLAPKMRFGAFIPPIHPLNENPTLALERDLELVQWMDTLGYDEAWIGEHHSTGFEIIASPELFIATVAERTRHIRLGTGVSSLPYHNPLTLAGRINQLDHITRGRVMLGVGPGSLPSDATMLGVPVSAQRDRMDESLDVVVRLLRGEVVSKKTEWFELEDALLQLTPWSRPSVEIAVASSLSPTGPTAAGRYGLGMLAFGATSGGGFNSLAANWALAEDTAREHGNTMDRSRWRLSGPMHIAETREQARADVAFGLKHWLYYFQNVIALRGPVADGDPIDHLIDSGQAVIGTPDDAIAQIERLQEKSGGFGCYMFFDHNWADWSAKKKSYEMMARYVFPRFQDSNINRQRSLDWTMSKNHIFGNQVLSAMSARVERHVAEKGDKNIQPGLAEFLNSAKTPDPAK